MLTISTLMFEVIPNAEASEWVYSKLLPVIAEFESGNNDKKIGKAGEVSRYQLHPKVISDFRIIFGAGYSHTAIARWYAERCLVTTRSDLPSYYLNEYCNFYLAWNGGLTYYSKVCYHKRKVSKKMHDRAARFANLAAEMIDNKKKP